MSGYDDYEEEQVVVRPVLKQTDMPADMVDDALALAEQAIEKATQEVREHTRVSLQ